MPWRELAVAIAVPLCGGLLSGLLGSRSDIISDRLRSRSWYQYLRKPKWAPAPWVFGPVWSTLRPEGLAMGYASYLVYKDHSEESKLPLTVYGCHLFFNFAWYDPDVILSCVATPIFFRMKRMDWALVDLSFVWASVVSCLVLFWPVNRIASALMAPYLAWCSLAWALNYSVWQMNRHAQLAYSISYLCYSKQA